MRAKLIVIGLLVSCGKDVPYTDRAGVCAAPRTGVDPNTGSAYPDRKGTLDDEKAWLLGWSQDFYLWYGELPQLDASKYTDAISYFLDLRTRATTPTGHPKDKFHFTYPTSAWEQLSQSGTSAGYGISWAEFAQSPPRIFYAAFVEPGSPADQAGIKRGAKLISVDGTALVDGDPAPLNAGLFPANEGETHQLEVLDWGAAATRTVSMTSKVISTPAVRDVTVVAGSVGYMNFNDHSADAEKLLSDAFTQLKSQNVTDLVLDLRYNGGGYIDIASEAAFMVSGVTGKVFEREQWNDKHPERASATGFHATAPGSPFPLTAGTPLPHLDLKTVYILTNAQTCSASEAIINGLRGVDVNVVLIGSQTCGKPYAFIPQDNCGTTYFTIQIQGVNAKGQGDYADGFVPTCQVADDFSHELGDPAEGMLAAALQMRAGGNCPAPTFNPEMKRGFDGRALQSSLRGLRIVGR